METPCPRCGALKTESVRHGFIYNQLWNMGYHLRRCSFCNRKRIFKRHDRNRAHPDDWTAEELAEYFNRRVAKSKGATYVAPKGLEGNMASNSPEEPRQHGEQPNSSSIGLAEATEETEDNGSCPRCGSIRFHRSRRRWHERMLRRPRIARCSKCGQRFPFPRSDEKQD